MVEVRQYEASDGTSAYARWFLRLETNAARRVNVTVAKLQAGLRPDVKGVGEGVMEARIDYGPGYRVYFAFDGIALIILLGGGDKRQQQRDIEEAKAAWTEYKARKKG